MGFESAFAGLPPSHVEREKLDAETLFVQGDGEVQQEEEDAYLRDTSRFQNAVSDFLSWMPISGLYALGLSFQLVARHMNDASRAGNFLNHIQSAMSSKNAEYLENLSRGINWGINAMFSSTDAPQTASAVSEEEERDSSYNFSTKKLSKSLRPQQKDIPGDRDTKTPMQSYPIILFCC